MCADFKVGVLGAGMMGAEIALCFAASGYPVTIKDTSLEIANRGKTRLEGILERHGVYINVSTMCDWVGKCADLLEPLVKRMHALIRLSPKINTDDTKIPVKNKNRKGSTYNGYLWAYIDNHFNVVFDFTPNRSRHGPIEFIGKKYKGYVQADAYSGNDELFEKTPATEVGCHAHARRKFEYAMHNCWLPDRTTPGRFWMK